MPQQASLSRTRAGAAAAVLALLVAGCSGPPSPAPTAPVTPEDTPTVGDTSSLASEEQRALLADGVTFAEYESAVLRSIRCMRDSGIDVQGGDVTSPRGFPEIRYMFAGSSAGRTDDQTLALADECMGTHSLLVESGYELSPASLEAQEKHFAPYRTPLIDCVRGSGGTIDDTLDWPELSAAAYDHLAAGGPNCLTQIGVPQ